MKSLLSNLVVTLKEQNLLPLDSECLGMSCPSGDSNQKGDLLVAGGPQVDTNESQSADSSLVNNLSIMALQA